MSKMDGWMATVEICRRKGTARRIPIIALTANRLSDDRERYLAAGMDDYLSKPLDLRALDAMLQRWVTDQSFAQEPADSLAPDVPEALDEAALDSTVLANLRNLEAASGKTISCYVDRSFLIYNPAQAGFPAIGHCGERGENSEPGSAHSEGQLFELRRTADGQALLRFGSPRPGRRSHRRGTPIDID